MYVGPWQEYRLGQMFNEQTRALADAVRAQIQAQIIQEQAARPQIQLPHMHGSSGAHPSRSQGSYSSQLRQQSSFQDRSHAASIASTASSASGSRGRSGASTANSSYAPSQRTHVSSAASAQHSTASALRSQGSSGGSGLFQHPSMLPPLQAAARAAVDNLHASRVRATANHPLAHIVGSYLPEAVSPSSAAAGALSRQSSQASSASANEAAQVSRGYCGGNPAHQYRPPAHAIPKVKRQPAARTEKQIAQAHREHLGKLRALYGLQNGGASSAAAAAGAAAGSAVASEAGTPAHAASPSASGGERLPSLPQLPQHAASQQSQPARSTSKPYVLPASVMPQLSATSLALYGPIPDELAASLSFYAKPPPAHPADAAALAAANRVAQRLPQEHVEEVSPSHHHSQQQQSQQPLRFNAPSGSTADSWLSSYSQQDSARPSSRDRSQPAQHHSVGPWNAPRPSSRGQLLTPLASQGASSSLRGSTMYHSGSASKLHHLPHAAAVPGTKMSAEQQWMAQQQAAAAAARAASELSDDSRLHTPMHPAAAGGHGSRSRLHTPQPHAHSRAQLHSSGGVSDAGFEHEVDDLLRWAAGVASTHDDGDEGRQIMQVHG